MRGEKCLDCYANECSGHEHAPASQYLGCYQSIHYCYFSDIDGIIFKKYHIDGADGTTTLNDQELILKGRGVTTKNSFYSFQAKTEYVLTPYKNEIGTHRYKVTLMEFNNRLFDLNIVHNFGNNDEHNVIKKIYLNQFDILKKYNGTFHQQNHPAWNEKNFYIHKIANNQIRRMGLFIPLGWTFNKYNKKVLHETGNTFIDILDADKLATFLDFVKKGEWFAKHFKQIDQNVNYLGNKIEKAAVNALHYSTGASLSIHQDLPQFDKRSVLIYHAKSQKKQNLDLIKQLKYVGFSGRINQPIYSGMMAATTERDMVLMGKKAGTEWYHFVPPVQSLQETTFQLRRLIKYAD